MASVYILRGSFGRHYIASTPNSRNIVVVVRTPRSESAIFKL
jgi:hypothetical protein